MGIALHDDLVSIVRQREPGREVALRCAVDQEPSARRPPSLGCQLLRTLERSRHGADVDPVRERRDVQAQRALADRLREAQVGARTALVAGHVQARRVALGVLDQCVQIGSLFLP